MIVSIVCEKFGISNPDEFSFMPEIALENKKDAKPKVKSDYADESKWLNPEKTLSEQGITENVIIILKKVSTLQLINYRNSFSRIKI